MARVNLKLCTLLIIGIPFMYTVYNWGQCDLGKEGLVMLDRDLAKSGDAFGAALRFQPREAQSIDIETDKSPLKYKEIECVVNNDFSIKARKESNDVYLPFTFIQRYFEVYGSMNSYDGYERFEFQHSFSQLHPVPSYSPTGVFMSFEFYNVEDRQRVKCISGEHGVPVSVQWDTRGHFYPIQIAQYGLSHYSKHLTEPQPSSFILEDGERGELNNWLLPDRKSQITIRTDKKNDKNNVIEFDTPENMKNNGITLSIPDQNMLTLSLDVKFVNNGSITVLLRTKDGATFRIHYILSDTMIYLQGQDLYYGLGMKTQGHWVHLTRKVLSDYDKGRVLHLSKQKRMKLPPLEGKIIAVCFRGHGFVDNVTINSDAHLDHFFDAANYLVSNQDSKGGWPIHVKRVLIPGELELQPGWYSAMGQGQAISLLVRAFSVTKQTKYMQAAARALNIFDIPSSQGGVLAKFADVYNWYEEYPTTPGSYVLNGFIYSLIGLYDLKQTAINKTEASHAERLYNTGMNTLKKMLLMFDTGSGTLYDLKHLALGLAPNRARWDYHSVHINQLMLLAVIDNDQLFHRTAERWTGYLKGKLSPHN